MLERFYPNEYLDSVYDIDFEIQTGNQRNNL